MAKYLSAKKLRVSETTRKYLMYAARTLPTLSKPKKLNGGTFGFHMASVLDKGNVADFKGHECGTIGCILGLMTYKARLDDVPQREISRFDTNRLFDLFYGAPGDDNPTLSSITNKTAARATEQFLKTGVIWFGKRKLSSAAAR